MCYKELRMPPLRCDKWKLFRNFSIAMLIGGQCVSGWVWLRFKGQVGSVRSRLKSEVIRGIYGICFLCFRSVCSVYEGQWCVYGIFYFWDAIRNEIKLSKHFITHSTGLWCVQSVCCVCVLSTTCLCFFIAEIYLLSRKDIGKTYQDSCQATGDGDGVKH